MLWFRFVEAILEAVSLEKLLSYLAITPYMLCALLISTALYDIGLDA